MGIILAIVLFSIIVTVHELGHFLLAKKNGIRVGEFSIGMGPSLLSKKIGETVYAIKLFPIGGSCVMGEDEVDDLSEGSFNSKSVWARISVIAAGPIFNFILAFILSAIIIAWVGYDPAVVPEITAGGAAQDAGMQAGDVIKKMNNKHINLYREVLMYNEFHQGETIDLVYERDGVKHEVTLEPRQNEEGRYLYGFSGRNAYEKATVLKTLEYGAYEVKYWICTTLSSLKMLITGQIGMDQLSGPVGIVDVVDSSYQASKPQGIAVTIGNLMNIAILLTANLGVMNLVPFPALDGGRLVFLVIEAIRGKRIAPEKEGMVHFTGLLLLFGLMIYVMFQDIGRLIH